jgi:hypothetical protein
MTIVREEENGNNGHHAGGVWRGRRCSSFLDTRTGALACVGLIDRSIESWHQIIVLQPENLLRCRNPRIADDHPPPAGR